MGYYNAGFDVVGVDICHQKNYPFEFHQADALEFLHLRGHEFDAIHASPPCQAYSETRKIQRNEHPDLIPPTRTALQKLGLPWVIENVPGAPLINPVMLCGAMFGLRTYRHRLFETSLPITVPAHPEHTAPQAKMGRPPKAGEFIHVVGNFPGVDYARKAMEIDWANRNEMAQAIPPAYTEYLGRQLRAALMLRQAA
jgi:DNA (cytosine-5)-methyltransferase 1